MNENSGCQNNEQMNRCIEGLRHMPSFERHRLVQGMMCLIIYYEDDLLDRFVLDFPLEPDNGQWYDQDPYLWLVINGLQYGNPSLQRQIAAYLAEELGENGTVSISHSPQCPGSMRNWA